MHRESLQSRSAIYLGRKQLRSFYRVSARKSVDRLIGYIVIKNESNWKEWNNYWDLVYWNWSFLSISIWDFMILLFWWKGIIYTKTFCFLAMTIIWIVPCGYKVNCSSTQCMPCFSFFLGEAVWLSWFESSRVHKRESGWRSVSGILRKRKDRFKPNQCSSLS